MKGFLLSVFVTAAVTCAYGADFVTTGDGQTYTPASLATNPEANMEQDGTVFKLKGNLTIAPTDILALDGDITLLIDGSASLTIQGHAEFNGTGTTTVGSLDAASPAHSIMIDDGSGTFNNIIFENIGLYSWTQEGLTVTGCTFRNVTTSSSTQAALAFGCSSSGNTVTDCTFVDNAIPGIGSAANAYCGITLENCTFTDCNSDNTNMPMINLTTPADNGPTIIRNNTIIGAKRSMVGGISVSNMMGASMGDVVIEGNEVRDCRYGINVFGPVNAQLRGNNLIDNRYEENPMNGGSAISCTAFSGLQNTIISGNHIEGSLWGVTLISYGFLMPGYYSGFALVSLGRPGDASINSPGENVFVANGNDGSGYDTEHPYDLYNNTDQTVYAQHNTWSVPEQTPEEIEKVIFHKADDNRYGEVIFMDDTEGVAGVGADNTDLRYDPATRTLIYSGIADSIEVYDIAGRNVADMEQTSMMSLSRLPRGVYLVVATRNGTRTTLRIAR